MEREIVWRVLAAILHLGNVFFEGEDGESAKETGRARVGNAKELVWVASLLQVDVHLLRGVLLAEGSIAKCLDARFISFIYRLRVPNSFANSRPNLCGS